MEGHKHLRKSLFEATGNIMGLQFYDPRVFHGQSTKDSSMHNLVHKMRNPETKPMTQNPNTGVFTFVLGFDGLGTKPLGGS